VKDWELGAFTPKTALPDNVDILNPRYYSQAKFPPALFGTGISSTPPA
jgi:hypothetical protein